VQPGLEDRLAEFTDLLATAIANTESREQLSRLAEEQAALRRVATLVAQGAPVQEILTAVAAEMGELPPGTEERTAAFTELAATAIANAEARTEVRELADEQSALRRVATMVARGAEADALFESVVEEVGTLLHADVAGITRFESGETLSALAAWSADGSRVTLPQRVPVGDAGLSAAILSSGEPVRIEDWRSLGGPIARIAHEEMGLRCSVGSPVVVDGTIWGALAVHSRTHLPAATESRLVSFADLVVSAITDAQARGEVRRLADEQAALRRVATLVANDASPDEVFNAVAEELGGLLGVEDTRMVRYEADDTATVVASVSRLSTLDLVGKRVALGGNNTVTRVQRTGRTARTDAASDATGRIGEYARMVGARSTVGTPIVVADRVWGAMLLTSGTGPLPAETEARSGEFTELVATAIANVEARSELAASRARVVAAADDERRRVVRDVHDGAQQRLVHLVVTLKLAARALGADRDHARELLREARGAAESANAELHELAQGILPEALTSGGLRAGVAAMASRMAVPVQVEVPDVRLTHAVEATGYFVVAEALTNVAKHSHAKLASVSAWVDDATLWVEVRDDGVGGARADGTGLVGLRDRLAALGGGLTLGSEPGGGTRVIARIPLEPAGDSA
jgi:signal transduction histidine kinase